MKSYSDLVLKNYIYCAPSYCYINDTLLNFTEVNSSKDINHEKIFLTTYCGDINTLKLQILASAEKFFVILKGKITIEYKCKRTVSFTFLRSCASGNTLT